MKNDNAFLDWLQAQFDIEELQYIVNNGVRGGGCNGLIYYSQTSELFHTYNVDILELISEYQKEIGEDCYIKISNFTNAQTLHNEIVWHASELGANQLIQQLEQEKEELEEKIQELINEYDVKILLSVLKENIEKLEEEIN